MPDQVILEQLVAMSNHLGDPAHDYAILGEGNTSARADAETFWVKASGAELRTMQAGDCVLMRFEPVLELLDAGDLDDATLKARLDAAKVDPGVTARPSVETALHALALQLEGVNFVGHTHPTAVNALLCSACAEEALAGRLFPDEIVYCGPASVYVPFTPPGLPLARAIRDYIRHYRDEYGEIPKVILMQNHGLIALGASARDVEATTAMAVKAARVRLGALTVGGLCHLSPEIVSLIHTSPAGRYRREKWK